MERYSDSVVDPTGAAVADALITVVNQDGTTPVLKDDDGGTLDNPLTSDEYGAFYFNLDEAGYVDLKFYYGGRLVQEQLGVVVGSPPPTTGAGGTTGQVQFNDDGDLGGFTGLTVAAGVLSNVTVAGGTDTTGTSVLTVNRTWNNSDVNLKAVEVNITNMASFRQSTFYRATMGGVTRFSVTRDDSLMFGDIDGHTDGADAAIGIRRMTGRVLGFCSQRSFDDGLPEAVMTTYWENSANGGYADKTVATLRGHGTNRFSIESDAALIHIAENGRFEWEVGFTSSDDRVKFIAYQKASSEGRSFDFRNYGQSVYADSVVCISSDTDAVDLLRFEKYAGSAWTTRAKIDAFGKVHTPAVVDGGTIVRAPGTSLTGTTAETTLATITLPANSMGPNGQIELETYFSCPANVNTKTLRVKFGGTTIFTSPAIGSTNTGHQAHIRTANKTAGTQVSFPTIGPGHGASTAAPVTSSVDTTSNVTILITGQLGDAGDTMILESYYVVTHYGA